VKLILGILNRSRKLIVITGGGGFIGGHLAKHFLDKGFAVRSVDIKPTSAWYQVHRDAENIVADIKLIDKAREAVKGAYEVYNLAADMGGMGFIETHKAQCMLSVLISTHVLMAAQEAGVEHFFYSSSACVYNADKQRHENVVPLKEADAYPAMAEDGYGWEKLFTERMCKHFTDDYGMYTRVARFHNVYGPEGTWDGGREKAPAAICRKVIEAKLTGNHNIEIWGDGHQTRSFMYIDDCVKGINMIMHNDVLEPINLGSDELVTINGLVDMVQDIAGIKLDRQHNLNAPKGVNGRNSDNTLIKEYLNWAPSIRLRDGMERTYKWIYDQYTARHIAATKRAA
jgi:nucleoside-diphosphate-sugar epimerase